MAPFRASKGPLFIFVFLWTRPLPSSGSAGDRSWEFTSCVSQCTPSCTENDLPLELKVFAWSCQDNCKYECMHSVTTQRTFQGERVLQYYGKWPFIRIFGVQEPASVLFSFMNLLGHFLGIKKLESQHDIGKYSSYGVFKANCVVNMNAWIWSIVFHTRDLPWTEMLIYLEFYCMVACGSNLRNFHHLGPGTVTLLVEKVDTTVGLPIMQTDYSSSTFRMDYFSASAAVMFSAFASLTRIIGRLHDVRTYISGLVLLSVLAHHVYTMNFITFDYGYNIKFNIFIGTMNVTLWLVWYVMVRKERPYAWKCAMVVLSAFFCVGLEILDFPPLLGFVDAHALWHLSTASLAYFWYCFLAEDAQHEIRRRTRDLKDD